VTVIYGVFSFLLGFFRVRALRFACAAIVILFYQFLAGFMPSLVRATAMILIGGAAMLFDRDQEPLNLLALACIGIVLGDPFQAFSLSFQLSFLALLGMLVLGPLIRFPLEGRLPRFLITAIAASAAAQAATLPLVIARFGVYYPSGLVASLVLVPLTTALLWAGLGWIPIYAVPWPWLHDACASAFAILYTLIDASARVLSWFPGIGFADFVVPWAVAGSCAVLVCLGILLPVRLRGAAPGIRAGGAAPGIRAGGAAPGIRAGGAAQ
jgi:competence protein ComEC